MSDWLPAAVVVGVMVVAIILVWMVTREGRSDRPSRQRWRRQVLMAAVLFVSVLAFIIALPSGTNQQTLLGVLGLVVTGALAISSQSIIANGMAGAMLRMVGSFSPGDFVEVDGQLGRVTENGLFHTEIQTSDRDLVTLPNALMVTKPVRVLRSSGTIVSVTASLGYDASRHVLEDLFVAAANNAGLEEPFVQVVELGDYSVVYRIAGFLADPRKLLGTRSDLRGQILDLLSDAGIEILSPMYVAKRDVGEGEVLPVNSGIGRAKPDRPTAEDRAFDKADVAAGITDANQRIGEAEQQVAELQGRAASAVDEIERADLERQAQSAGIRVDQLRRRLGHLLALHEED